jgi:hypothetical protein
MSEEVVALIGFAAIGLLAIIFFSTRRNAARNSQGGGMTYGGSQISWLERSMDWEFKKRRFWAVVWSWCWGFVFGAITASILLLYYFA